MTVSSLHEASCFDFAFVNAPSFCGPVTIAAPKPPPTKDRPRQITGFRRPPDTLPWLKADR